MAEHGYTAQTETDTETIVLLAQSYLDAGATPREAAEKTIARLKGAYALAFLFEGEDDLMIAARKGSPLAIGHGEGEMFLGSDAIALALLTDRVTYLEEGDMAVLTRAGVEIVDAAGRRANRAVKQLAVDVARIEKAGHKHFMAKEIAEQPHVVAEALETYVDGGNLSFPDALPDFKEIDRILLVACGTGFYACDIAKYWFEGMAGIPVEADIASEFRYRNPPIGPNTLAIFVSQSGETADTLAALRHVGERASRVAVVNVEESSIARECDVILPIHAGTEIGVASTKAFTCQLTVLAALALRAASDRGTLDAQTLGEHITDLKTLPGRLSQALAIEPVIEALSRSLAEAQDILFLGRGPLYPLAMEGALKLKEISYIHAEGYASGELKHGPIALIDAHVPVIVLAPRDALFDKTVSNMQEVMARGGQVVLVSDQTGLDEGGDGVWKALAMPASPDFTTPILYAIPAQLIAYHTAIAKGTDVDQPRNLAKSVTVE